jgi:hypothetical protein
MSEHQQTSAFQVVPVTRGSSGLRRPLRSSVTSGPSAMTSWMPCSVAEKARMNINS